MRGACMLIVLAAAPFPLCHADEIIKAGNVDVWDLSRSGGLKGYDLCGMRAMVRQPLATGAERKWDLIWSVVTDGSTQVAIVTANVFMAAKPGVSVPPVIAELAFSIEGNTAAATVLKPIDRRPKYAFEGKIPESYAERVFAALDAGIPISVEATYESGEHEMLVMQAHGGIWSEYVYGTLSDTITHGRSTVDLCLEHLVPPSGTLRRVVERVHDGS
jgi:hypothetical protein